MDSTRTTRRALLAVAAIPLIGLGPLWGCGSGEPPPAQLPAPASVQAPAKPRPCSTCGVVTSIEKVVQKGEGSGLGAVAGGVLGAVVGYQFGGGTGKAVTTAGGAAGGALAGNEIEKQVRKTAHYTVHVRLDDGSSRAVSFDSEPSWRVGDKVKVEGRGLLRAD